MRHAIRHILLTPLLGSLAVTSTLAQDFEFPTRKSGLWEIRMATGAAGPLDMTVRACVDEATDGEMMRAGFNMSKSMCPEQDMKRDGDAYVIDSTCQISGMTTKSRIVIMGDFQSSYQVDIQSEASGAPGPMAGTTSMTQTATWLGAECTDGLAPGDLLMPGGMKMNIKDMLKSMGG